MDITCIGHSGFLVELPENNLIFDYFTDESNIITPELFKNKNTCVFVSHNHHDHYNKKIFDWINSNNIIYILDKGCEAQKNKKIIKTREGSNFDIFGGTVNIQTYGSTDEGLSFLVKAGGYNIFHAGDLNDWYWEGESTPDELIQDEENYINILKKIAGQGITINIAFIPEDPRLGRNSGRGIKYFKEIVNPEKIIPMHFPGNNGVKYIDE